MKKNFTTNLAQEVFHGLPLGMPPNMLPYKITLAIILCEGEHTLDCFIYGSRTFLSKFIL
jgi:hypothetical protein